MILVKIRIKGEAINFIKKPIISAGDIGVTRCKFVFDSVWEGLTKKAIFSVNNKYPYEATLTNDECYIPTDALANKCRLYIGVIGTSTNKQITSKQIIYEIVQNPNGVESIDIRTEKIKNVVRDYCTEQNYATKTYVDSKQCNCESKNYATKTYVDTAIAGVEVGYDPEAIQDAVETYIDGKNYATKGYVDSKQFDPDEDQVKQYVQEYCENNAVATVDYVDSAIENIECDCDLESIEEAIDDYVEEKQLVTKTYVDETVTAALLEQDEPTDLNLNGGDADPETHYDDDENLYYIFNGGKAKDF